jgi:hypothetical protein
MEAAACGSPLVSLPTGVLSEIHEPGHVIDKWDIADRRRAIRMMPLRDLLFISVVFALQLG